MESPSPKVFTALLSGDIKLLCSCSPQDLRPFLTCLARIVLSGASTAATSASSWQSKRKAVHALIAGLQEANSIKQYLSVDFQELKQDALKEQQLLRKLPSGEERAPAQSVLASSLQYGLAIEFERSDHMRRLRLILSELLRVMSQVDTPFKLDQSDLFECDIHLEEIGDILCVLAAELPSLLPVVRVSEALLRLEKGPHLLCRLVANIPDCFDRVVTSLVLNGEALDEVSLSGRCRTTTIKSLCSLHPSRSTYVQSLAVRNCKLPTLALSLALDSEDYRGRPAVGVEPSQEAVSMDSGLGLEPEGSSQSGVVTLLHNILITGDEQTKAWFAQYMKLMQQKFRRQKSSAVSKLRRFIIRNLLSFSKPTNQVQTGTDPETDPGTGTEPEDGTEDETMETELVIDMNGQGEAKVGVEEEVGPEAVAASTLELVDQMEIEISDHERGEGSGGEEKSKQGDEKPKEQSSAPPVGRRRRYSSIHDKVDFPPLSLNRQLSDNEVLELMGLLHVCCGLKVQAQMYLTNEETAAILSVIACSCPPFSPAGVRFVQVMLCVLLACPFLISLEECEHAVVQWFQWLLEKLPEFDRACEGECSYGELLLLIAIHLREGQLPQLEELISDTLQMKVSSSLKRGHFSMLRQLFLKVFTEEVVCTHAVSVPPTPSLSGHMTGYLPVHCVHQLIKTRTFRKYGVSIKDWIYQQLLTVAEPLHPTLPPLTQAFVTSILLPGMVSQATAYRSGSSAPPPANNKPFSAEEVLRVFRQSPSGTNPAYPIPSQLLMFYYVLLYQDCSLTNLKSLLMQPGGHSPTAYSPTVLAQIPMMQLLQHARQHQAAYTTLYPSLLKLTATHLPHLCLVENWLKEEEGTSSTTLFISIAKFSREKINPASSKEVLQHLQKSPSKALLLLSHLSTLPPSSLILHCPSLTSTLPLLLTPSVPRRIQALYLRLWTKVNTVIPRKYYVKKIVESLGCRGNLELVQVQDFLDNPETHQFSSHTDYSRVSLTLWLETVNALRPSETRQMRPLTHQNLTEDPLTILRCDPRVFRCPPVFEILLRILAAYSSASRAWLQEHTHTQNCVAMTTPESPTAHVTKEERDELCIALTAAQESASIQLLLEVCLPNDEDRKSQAQFGPQLSALQEIRCLVCSYLHQTFIAEPSLVKLVHFQGYPPELLPMMVSGVPSMHICLDFIPELLGQPQTEKQQFAVQLAASIIHQYPLPETMGIAKDIFKRLTLLTNEIPTDMQENYFLPLLPAVVQLCRTFPPVCSDATEFLVQLSKVCVPSNRSTNISFPSNSDTGLLRRSPRAEMYQDEKLGGLFESIQNTFQELVSSTIVKV